MTKLSFIGCGNMAQAMMKGILSQGRISADDIYTTNASEEHAKQIHDLFGVHASTDNCEATRQSDIVFLSVKPQQYESVLLEIRDQLHDDHILVTVAPGKTIAWLEERVSKPIKIVRTAPNTPAHVGEGMTAYCENSKVEPADLALVENLLSSFGATIHLKESLIDPASSVGGSAPAYVYQFIESLADGGVAEGLPRQIAYTIAAQAVLGSAKMVLESGKHPGQLKDEVCSPGGSTIKGVEVLENGGFRGTVISAIRTCIQAARNL